ncbi:hypothetical protein [Gayadomonas joobiniege]|uniref:hypothetical protein n=1 Tax=Gayadomonas joobiniege TaxID=1234606 RepID=UPI00138AD5C5|nr:hypothetical protein [Gayadomonas joobiniege]
MARNRTLLWFFLFASLAGLIYDMNFVPVWRGAVVEVGGVEIEAARYWTSFGTVRYAGFTNASFALASWVCLLACLLLKEYRFKGLQSLFVVCFSLYIVYASNTKSFIAALVLIYLFYFIARFLPNNFDKVFPASILFTVICFPVMCVSGLLDLGAIVDRSSTVFFSLVVRSEYTWPLSFSLLETTVTQLFGLGIGGIGTVQAKLNGSPLSTADNLFVYLYCMFGIFSLVISYYLFYLIFTSDRRATYYRAILSLVLFFGITGNVIENPASMLLLAYAILNLVKPETLQATEFSSAKYTN